jgi:pimeloyl-ACP methyl ester carboxylesterase
MQIKRGLIETPDGYLHYREAGQGSPVVLLHQVPLSSLEFSEVLPMLARRRRVIALDLPGYGCSDAPARGFVMNDYVAAVLRLLDELQFEHIDLLGVQAGAAIATAVAAAHPERVRRMILGGAPAWPQWSQRYEMFARCQPFDFDAEGTALREQWEQLRQATDDAKLMRRFIREKVKAGPLWYTAQVAVFTHDFIADFKRVQAPTLLLNGSRSLLADLSEPLTRLRPDVHETMIAGGGDWLAWEMPERVADEVEHFLG